MLTSGKTILRAVLLLSTLAVALLVAHSIVGSPSKTTPLDQLFWTSGVNSTVAPQPIIKIEGEVSRGLHAQVPEQILEQVALGVDEINIEIDTPGGSVSMMLAIMNAMDQARARGIKLVCTVTRQAASAGFLIFNHCDKRYAHELANLMWHSVGVYLDGPYNLVSLRALISDLEALQYWGNTMIQAQLKLPPAFFSEMWLTELTLTAPQLKSLAPHYLEVIPYVAH